MSRTYRKYPTYLYKKHGEYYRDLDEIPGPRRMRQKWVWEEYLAEEEVWKDWYKGHRFGGTYKTTVLVKKRRRKYLNEWEEVPSWWYWTPIETVYLYDTKTYREGAYPNRVWHCGGVGKKNKQCRNRAYRSRAKNELRSQRVWDDTYEMPSNKKTDRWDYW
jgi:hypothetical protein